ncbi:MAG: 50S ribosomal protein L10 [Dehalococcoidia bacterium]
MPTERKIQIVEQLTELLSRSKFVIATDYRGLTVTEVSELRRQLRELGTEYHVVKNNLARFAAERSGKEELCQLLSGPVALAFGYDDAAPLAKALVDYARTSKTSLSIKGGLIDSQLLSGEEMSRLATLPPIEVLRARLLGLLQGPAFALQNVLSANLYGLYSALNARIQQLGGTSDV